MRPLWGGVLATVTGGFCDMVSGYQLLITVQRSQFNAY